MKRRIGLAALIGCAYGLLSYVWLSAHPTMQAVDFTYPWLAAKAIASGLDPYAYVAHSVTPASATLFYPMPAAIVVLPFAWMRVQVAGALFVAIGCGTLAFALTNRDPWRLLVFLTAPMYQVALSAQWSPLLMASALFPAALGLVACKPNLALPLLAYQNTRCALAYTLIGAGALAILSFALQPHWLAHWYQTMHNAPESGQYRVPVLTVWGLPVLLALFRWRDRDARLLVAMACTPQNSFFYDQLPLFLVARTRRELLVWAILSWPIFLVRMRHAMSDPTVAVQDATYVPLMMLGMYLPALIIVLRHPRHPAAES